MTVFVAVAEKVNFAGAAPPARHVSSGCHARRIRWHSLEAERRQAGMVVWPAPLLPSKLTVRVHDRKVIDAGVAYLHQATCVELPIFVAVGAEPIVRIVAPFIGKAHGDPVLCIGPEFLEGRY